MIEFTLIQFLVVAESGLPSFRRGRIDQPIFIRRDHGSGFPDDRGFVGAFFRHRLRPASFPAGDLANASPLSDESFCAGANTKKKCRITHGVQLQIMEASRTTMKSLHTLIAAFLVTAWAAPAAAQTYDFSSAKPVEDYLAFAKQRSARPHMTIEAGEDGDLLTFRTEEGAGELAVFQPDGKSAPAAVREIEVVLRTEGSVTFGVFARAGAWDEPAYLTFFGPDAEGTARLSLAKNPLSASQKISEGLLANKHVKGAYDQSLWHALRIRLSDEADGSVAWTADLVEWPENRVVLSVAAQDTENPLTSGDQLGLRFYCGTQGAIQIKSITLSE